MANMIFRRFCLFFAIIVWISVANASDSAPSNEFNAIVAVAFGRDCKPLLLDRIGHANEEILVAIYSFTRRDITGALIAAAERGVTVHVKYDKTSAEWKGMKQTIGRLKKRKVRCTEIKMSGEYARMHNKFTVIDRRCVLTGSYNYTTTASTQNHENLVAIESPEIAQAFVAEFNCIKDDAIEESGAQQADGTR
ncbi:MAG: DUF1669 domain-containing protein [Lentisphaerae bacterium]|nr:DUF1669 domain-containing protein [Lentisphaerota bacterium]